MIGHAAWGRWLALLAYGVLLAGCAGPSLPPTEGQGDIIHFRQTLDGSYIVDFQVEMRRSGIDGQSCFAFVSGTLGNRSETTLSRRTGLQFFVYGEGRLLFRDLTHPRTEVPPGSQVQFELFQSPLHHKHCPRYDRIEVVLIKATLPAP